MTDHAQGRGKCVGCGEIEPCDGCPSADAIGQVRVLLQKIYDLIDAEDAAEPLDDAIALAKKGLEILDGKSADVTGYVLMPREATRDMTMAACDQLPACEHVFGYAGEMLRKA